MALKYYLKNITKLALCQLITTNYYMYKVYKTLTCFKPSDGLK